MSDLRPFDRQIEFLSREEIETLQLKKLRDVLCHAEATNAFYAERWRAAGVTASRIETFADFRQYIPMIEKSDVMEDQRQHPPYGRRLAQLSEHAKRVEVYTTSGTTGKGVEIHAQSKAELAVMERLYAHYFSWAGLNPGDATALTLPITMLAGGRAEYQGAIAYDLSVFPIGNYTASEKVETIGRFRPRALFGSSSYFAHLAAELGGSAPTSGVEVLLTGLEGSSIPFLERLESRWGARVAERFGCAQMRADFMFTDERGIGTPKSPGTLLNMDPYVYLEVLDTTTGLPVADGEFGELVVTSLYHFDYPLIRSRLRDGGVFVSGAKAGGPRRFNGIELASVKRIDDVKKIKGINVYPQAVDELVYSHPEVEQYEVLLKSTEDMRDVATIRLVLHKRYSSADHSQVTSSLRARCKAHLGINFEVEIVEELPVSGYKVRRWRDLRER